MEGFFLEPFLNAPCQATGHLSQWVCMQSRDPMIPSMFLCFFLWSFKMDSRSLEEGALRYSLRCSSTTMSLKFVKQSLAKVRDMEKQSVKQCGGTPCARHFSGSGNFASMEADSLLKQSVLSWQKGFPLLPKSSKRHWNLVLDTLNIISNSLPLNKGVGPRQSHMMQAWAWVWRNCLLLSRGSVL